MLTIKKLTKAHAGRTLFRETEMTINWGERVALVGPNGAGKSTLFRIPKFNIHAMQFGDSLDNR